MEIQRTATRPSLYAAIKLARLVQKFRERLKARVRTNRSCGRPSAICQTLDSQALTTLSRGLLPNDPKGSTSREINCLPRTGTSESSELAAPTLLTKLDSHLVSNSLSFVEVASRENLFLHYDIQRSVANVAIEGLRQVLDLTTALLRRIYHEREISGAQRHEGVERSPIFDSIRCEKLAANLEHILLCLQQATLQAIIQRCLEPLEAEILDWRLDWRRHQQLEKRFNNRWFIQKRLNDEWFSEWPGGRRPLSTTWPWNIRPSLVVLWGVCWMFYTFNREAQQEPRRGNSSTGEQPDLLPNLQNYGETWIGGGSVTRPLGPNIVQRPSQPGLRVGTTFTRAPDVTGPRVASATLTVPSTGFPYSNTLTSPLRRRSASNPYIISSTTSSSALYTPLTSIWPPNPDINITPDAFGESPYQWTSNTDQLNTQPPNPQLYAFDSVSNPHAEDYTNSSSADQTPYAWYRPDHYTNNVDLGVLADLSMPDIPSPPHSEASRVASSPCASNLANLSPGIRCTQSPSTAHSPDSHQDVKGDLDPPKNANGDFFCSHTHCSTKIPVFSRKCEWAKHMDKHTRPYVCKEAGCEKIQGFTYSGGLLRHQREVHKHHGGPKAPRMCPFPDCKRSTGSGFSRKENLQEHLRRVHRGTGQATDKGAAGHDRTLTGRQQLIIDPATGVSKGKRRRLVEEEKDDNDIADEMGELRAQIKRLKKEAEEKDRRLMALENQVQTLYTRPQHRSH